MAVKKQKEIKSESKTDQIDVLANDVLAIVNKKFKEFPDAMTFMKDANMVTDWISTGCDILDLAISNKPNGGLPCAKIVEFNGLEGSGKSLLAAHVMAECQKKGGIAVLYDIEGAVGMLDFYQSLGLNTDKLLYIDKLRTLEEVYASMETIIEKAILNNKDIPITIVLDSVTGATTIKELEEDYEKKGFATEKAKVNSGAMRRIPTLINGRKILIILIQQLRANMNAVGFGADPWCVDPITTKIKIRYKK